LSANTQLSHRDDSTIIDFPCLPHLSKNVFRNEGSLIIASVAVSDEARQAGSFIIAQAPLDIWLEVDLLWRASQLLIMPGKTERWGYEDVRQVTGDDDYAIFPPSVSHHQGAPNRFLYSSE
jgi:hypothetical protein